MHRQRRLSTSSLESQRRHGPTATPPAATIGYVYRFDPPGKKKEFRPLTLRRVNDKLEWRWEGWPPKRPLYGLHKLAERPSAKVLVAEGEKSADAAQKLLPDYVTVTSPNGSNAADKADWSPLRDRESSSGRMPTLQARNTEKT